MAAFRRPDVLLQPGHQRQVVGVAPQQVHGGVAVQVHQARDQGVVAEPDMLGRLPVRFGFRRRHQGGDTAALHQQAVVHQHLSGGPDGDDPAGIDAQIG